jgi:hypothetical protein
VARLTISAKIIDLLMMKVERNVERNGEIVVRMKEKVVNLWELNVIIQL